MIEPANLQIRTPEGVTFSYPLAGPVTRALAWLIDIAIMIALTIGIIVISVMSAIVAPDLAGGFAFIGWFLLQTGYGMFFEWFWRGQTPGKRVMRLRVIDSEGLRLQFSQVAARNIMRLLDILPMLYCVGGIACMLNRRFQRLGDIVANTVVVRMVPVADPEYSQVDAGKYNSLRSHPHLQARLRQRVTAGEAGLALRAVLRREKLDTDARAELFRELAAHFQALVPVPPDVLEGVSDEQYVRNVVETVFTDSRTRHL